MSIERKQFPILEYDPDPEGIIRPHIEVKEGVTVPSRCVICFFRDVIDRYSAESGLEPVDHIKSELGPLPIYVADRHGARCALVSPGVGAPLAAGVMEIMIEYGCTSFVTCGGAGVLDSGIAPGHLLVPSVAVRAEGTSYHYLPPSREVSADPGATAAICRYLTDRNIPFDQVKTWTTDAFYRETKAMIAARTKEGCACVEMECAAFFAVASFRNVEVASILYGGDDVSGDVWDPRQWNRKHGVRRNLMELAMDACIAM